MTTKPPVHPPEPPHPHAAKGISLLVPFRNDGAFRTKTWHWLERYWRAELPNVEIVVGRDRYSEGNRAPFSKTVAVNDAFRRCHGDVIVILDADAYLPGEVIQHCADRIRSARESGVRMWFVPYRSIYRLTRETSADVVESNPHDPPRFPTPPPPEDVEDTAGTGWGHRYGALIQIMPREGFETVGCMDPRFRGWGGEDVSFLRALDTLWVKHKNTPNDVLHLWHPKFHVGHDGDDEKPLTTIWMTRVWVGQATARANDWLAIQYNKATNRPEKMRELVDAGCEGVWHHRVRRNVINWLRHWIFFWQHGPLTGKPDSSRG